MACFSLCYDMFMQLCSAALGKLNKPFEVHSAEANGVMAVKAWGSSEKGSIKTHHTIIAMIIAILYFPVHSLLPVLTISKDQKGQRWSCAT